MFNCVFCNSEINNKIYNIDCNSKLCFDYHVRYWFLDKKLIQIYFHHYDDDARYDVNYILRDNPRLEIDMYFIHGSHKQVVKLPTSKIIVTPFNFFKKLPILLTFS